MVVDDDDIGAYVGLLDRIFARDLVYLSKINDLIKGFCIMR
jgi:hypothetical protein